MGSKDIGLHERLYVISRNLGFRLNKSLGPLLGKVNSILSIYRAYGLDGFSVIKAYITGSEVRICGTRVKGWAPAGMASWLAKFIASGYVRMGDGVVEVDAGGGRLVVPLEHLLSPHAPDALHSITMLVMLRRFGGACAKWSRGFICSMSGLKFLARKLADVDLPLSDDLYAGPLLGVFNEKFEVGFFVKVLKNLNEPFVVDVGAYIGGYSVRACTMGASVIALEPDVDNFEALRLNLELNNCQNYKALQMAAGAEEHVAPLYQGRGFTTATLLSRFEHSTGFVKSYVKVATLDDMLRSEGWIPNSRVDYLKIDVEGAEIDVLKGATETLERTRYLQVEARRYNMPEVLSILRRFGFRKLVAMEYGDYENVILRKM